ncbi:MAG: hypothetical protein ABSG19_13520 [Candidatus Aminicenantales bacterium]
MKKTWAEKLEAHKNLLEKKGHKILRRGKKYQVADFEKRLAAFQP